MQHHHGPEHAAHRGHAGDGHGEVVRVVQGHDSPVPAAGLRHLGQSDQGEESLPHG